MEAQPARESNSSPVRRRRWIAIPLLVLAGLVSLSWRIATLPRVGLAAYEQIRIGMTRHEVYELLGNSHYETAMLGKVDSSSSFTAIFDTDRQGLYGKGYRDYLCEGWYSPEISIGVVFDRSGKAVCRSKSAGQKRTVMGILWPKKRAVLPPPPAGFE